MPGVVPGVTPKAISTYVDLALRMAIFYDSGITWVPRVVRYARQWQTNGNKPVVLSTSPPIHTHFAAYLMKRLYGWKWVADFRDPLVGGTGRKATRARHYDPYFERLFIRNADILIANTDAARELWQSRNPAYAGKVRALWNGFDPDDFENVPPPPAGSRKLISHVGDIYGPRDPLFLFQAISALVDKGRLAPGDVRLEFHGMSPEHAMVSSAASRLKELGCLFHNPDTPTKAQSETAMRAADILLLVDFTEPSPLHIPSKVFFYVRTGRPILASTPAGSPAQRILSKSGMPHICVHPGDSQERVESSVMEILAVPPGPHTPSDWFFDTFDSSRQSRTLGQWIEQLSGH